MKVYVITAGEYSDYHIVGVATTIEMAETIISKIDPYDYFETSPQINEYETDIYEPLRTSKIWRVDEDWSNNGEIKCNEASPSDCGGVNKVRTSYKSVAHSYFSTYVYAVNKETAIKIARDMFAEERAKMEGLV